MSRLHGFAALCVLALVARPSPSAAQRDFSDVTIEPTKVAGNVYMLKGAGGNIGVSIGADGALLIDDQFAPLAEKILAAIDELGGQRPKYILNTHWHADHTGGNEFFGESGTIIAHSNVRTRLSTPQEVRGRTVEPLGPGGLPVITFDESLSVHFNGEEIQVLHYPKSHTDGDSVIYFTKSNVVHMGDIMFAGMFPFVDLDSGGDVRGMISSVEHVLSRIEKDTKVIPGHGPLSDPEGLKTYHRMLLETTAFVKKAMADGKSLEQIKTMPLPKEWQSWGTGFIKDDAWVETIYRCHADD